MVPHGWIQYQQVTSWNWFMSFVKRFQGALKGKLGQKKWHHLQPRSLTRNADPFGGSKLITGAYDLKLSGDCIKSVRSIVPPENEEEAIDTWPKWSTENISVFFPENLLESLQNSILNLHSSQTSPPFLKYTKGHQNWNRNSACASSKEV